MNSASLIRSVILFFASKMDQQSLKTANLNFQTTALESLECQISIYIYISKSISIYLYLYIIIYIYLYMDTHSTTALASLTSNPNHTFVGSSSCHSCSTRSISGSKQRRGRWIPSSRLEPPAVPRTWRCFNDIWVS
jgi:hypothetical protein